MLIAQNKERRRFTMEHMGSWEQRVLQTVLKKRAHRRFRKWQKGYES